MSLRTPALVLLLAACTSRPPPDAPEPSTTGAPASTPPAEPVAPAPPAPVIVPLPNQPEPPPEPLPETPEPETRALLAACVEPFLHGLPEEALNIWKSPVAKGSSVPPVRFIRGASSPSVVRP